MPTPDPQQLIDALTANGWHTHDNGGSDGQGGINLWYPESRGLRSIHVPASTGAIGSTLANLARDAEIGRRAAAVLASLGGQQTDPDKPCAHPNFDAMVNVGRIGEGDSPDGMPTWYSAEISVNCAACGEDFRWVGLPAGLNPRQPMVSVDETELRAPMRPASSDPDFGLGIPGFAITAHAPEQGTSRDPGPTHRAQSDLADADAALRRLGDQANHLVQQLNAACAARQRIADAHHKHVDAHGGTWGECAECGHGWPCATYAWAASNRDPLAAWDPADDAAPASTADACLGEPFCSRACCGPKLTEPGVTDNHPYIWTTPARLGGVPCIGGHRLSADHIASIAVDGVSAVLWLYPQLTREQVLLACWHTAVYGEMRRWAEWARAHESAMWAGRWADVPEPPNVAAPQTDESEPDWGEEYTTGTGQHLRVHAAADCRVADQPDVYCVIHRRKPGHMATWPTHWRDDRRLMEVLCPHGVGHPAPESLRGDGVHGCCPAGCCVVPVPAVPEVVTDPGLPADALTAVRFDGEGQVLDAAKLAGIAGQPACCEGHDRFDECRVLPTGAVIFCCRKCPVNSRTANQQRGGDDA